MLLLDRTTVVEVPFFPEALPFQLTFLNTLFYVRRCQYNLMFLGLSFPDGVQPRTVKKYWEPFTFKERRAELLPNFPTLLEVTFHFFISKAGTCF